MYVDKVRNETITELVDLSENCSRKGVASDESAKSVIAK